MYSINWKREYVIYLMKCILCKMKYVVKIGTTFIYIYIYIYIYITIYVCIIYNMHSKNNASKNNDFPTIFGRKYFEGKFGNFKFNKAYMA